MILAFLAGLTKLERLHLNGNKISDVSVLESLPDLRAARYGTELDQKNTETGSSKIELV